MGTLINSFLVCVAMLIILLSNNVLALEIDRDFLISASNINNADIPVNTKEIIKVKNLDFTGNIKNKLLSECVSDSYNKCSFDEKGKIRLNVLNMAV